MRLSILTVSFMALGLVSAQLTAILGAAKGVAALTASVGKLGAMMIPAGLLLPFATIGPLKLSLPILLLMKKAGLFKVKLILVKAAFVAPVGVATAKIALLKASLGVGKSTFLAAGKTKVGLLKLPVTLAAAKMGGVLGAFSGAKGGLAAFKSSPGVSFREIFARQASLIRTPKIPMKTVMFGVYHPESTRPKVTPQPGPAYETPAPAEPSYGAPAQAEPSYAPAPEKPASPAYGPQPEEPASPAYEAPAPAGPVYETAAPQEAAPSY